MPSTFSLQIQFPFSGSHLGSLSRLPATMQPHCLHPVEPKSKWLSAHRSHLSPVTPERHWHFPSELHCKLHDPTGRQNVMRLRSKYIHLNSTIKTTCCSAPSCRRFRVFRVKRENAKYLTILIFPRITTMRPYPNYGWQFRNSKYGVFK